MSLPLSQLFLSLCWKPQDTKVDFDPPEINLASKDRKMVRWRLEQIIFNMVTSSEIYLTRKLQVRLENFYTQYDGKCDGRGE